MVTTGTVNLSPELWEEEELDRYLTLNRQSWAEVRQPHPLAVGKQGAVAGTSGAPAVHAGLEALRQGGTAVDAALTTSLAQITVNFGAVISFAGIMSMVYYEAASGDVHTLNACYNTVRAETDPMSIPGIVNPLGNPWDSNPSGRSALVPGFMAGVEAAHARFGRLPFEQLFVPSLYFAETGLEIDSRTATFIEQRKPVLSRRPETRAVFTAADGAFVQEGALLRQPALADTLRHVAQEGAGYMYRGPWAERFVEAVRSEGGHMAPEDLADYEVIWSEPLRSTYRGYEVAAYGLPALGGVHTIEAFNLLELTGIGDLPSYRESTEKFATFVDITKLTGLSYLPRESFETVVPGLDLSLESRLDKRTSASLWEAVRSGRLDVLALMDARRRSLGERKHSAGVVAADQLGNVCTIVHSINAVMWGGTGIFVDGVSIPDSASFQQAAIAQAGPGTRLPDPTNPFLVLRAGRPVLASSAIGSGLNERTMQCAVSVLDYGMNPKEAVDAPGFLRTDPFAEGGSATLIAEGEFGPGFLDQVRERGVRLQIIPPERRPLNDGYWIGISIDPDTGQLSAADPGRAGARAEAY